MAPIKHNRESARNRDKTKRRRRPAEHANHLLYRCMGDLCGEECDQELTPVSGRRSDAKRALQQPPDMEMDAAGSDADDADYAPDERERRRQPTMKAGGGGRVGKATAKKASTAKQIKDMPVKLGLQKAERYLCNALDFGVQAGYLTPKDAKGRVLRVASGLLQTSTTSSVKRINTDAMDARALERRAPAASTRAATQRRSGAAAGVPQLRDSQYDPTSQSQEVRDDDGGDVTESRRHRRSGGGGKKRSRSSRRHHGRKRSGKSRSRSRSNKRRHGRRRSMGRSRSLNPEGDGKQISADGSEEQDDLGDHSQQTTTSTSSNTSRNDDDGKSVKSTKSSKSTANNNDSQTSSEDKNKHNDNASNDDDASDDDDDDNQKK